MSLRTSSREVLVSLACGLAAAASNGLIYAYSIYSTRMALVLGLSMGDVVLLGVVEQAGWGLVLLPITLALRRARQQGMGLGELDRMHLAFNVTLFLVATLGLGGLLSVGEANEVQPTPPRDGATFAALCFCFLCFGGAAGSTALLIMSIANHNLVNTVPDGIRRRALAALSLSVALGGILFVCVYEFFLKDGIMQLSSVFYGKAAWYLVLGVAEFRYMNRVKPRRGEETSRGGGGTATVAVAVEPLTVVSLLRHSLVREMFFSTFFAIGVSGTFLSSIGNFISPSLTFMLTMLFLSSQALARLVNAVVYAGGQWPYLFGLWHLVCLVGVAVFLAEATERSAYASSVLVGLSFGGFHSAMPVITAVGFPGSVDDYPQSFAIVELVGSLGAIIVGQISVSVYHATSLSDFSVDMTFVFFVVASFVAMLSSFDMGRRLTVKDASVATAPASSVGESGVELTVAAVGAAAEAGGDADPGLVEAGVVVPRSASSSSSRSASASMSAGFDGFERSSGATMRESESSAAAMGGMGGMGGGGDGVGGKGGGGNSG